VSHCTNEVAVQKVFAPPGFDVRDERHFGHVRALVHAVREAGVARLDAL
jgi:hypothetical protein